MHVLQKLKVLADAAKYDASCASSGANSKKASDADRGMGSTGGMGICHSYTPDGRCISLLKILMTNVCVFDCHYCINRKSSNVQRARFSIDEVVELTTDFYRRNLIEGLFLSSGIIQTPDYTMEQLIEIARKLREEHFFYGYIHLKTIPDADPALLSRAGRYADRLSINLELPSAQSLQMYAPEKDLVGIKKSMARIRVLKDESQENAKQKRQLKIYAGAFGPAPRTNSTKAPTFASAGQSTQIIVGADRSDDKTILHTAHGLYQGYRMRRVYYSAFSPIPDASPLLPLQAAPLVREHRLYQADWLLRFYGFEIDEITTQSDGMLSLDHDPKMAWALQHPEIFPVDVNVAPKEVLLRVPGLGVRGVQHILKARKWSTLRLNDLMSMKLAVKKALPFIRLPDHTPSQVQLTSISDPVIKPTRQQLSLFA